LFDAQGKMYLHTGCDKFTRYLALEPGCRLTFVYEGDVGPLEPPPGANECADKNDHFRVCQATNGRARTI
jgi:hypothetical protein